MTNAGLTELIEYTGQIREIEIKSLHQASLNVNLSPKVFEFREVVRSDL